LRYESQMKIVMGMALWGVLCCAPLFVHGEEKTNAAAATVPSPTSIPLTNQPPPAGAIPIPGQVSAPASVSVTNQPPPVASTDGSVDSLREKAEAGDAKSQTKLGHIYQAGKIVPRDINQAVQWYRRAADQDDADGQWSLGSCFAFGIGVQRDPSEAVKWYRKSADQGNYIAMQWLSILYSAGIGGAQDQIESDKWKQEEIKYCRLDADRGNAEAQSDLGSWYEYGYGVAKDLVEAAKWYRKAADQGDSDAESALGKFYANGISVKKDVIEAAKWYRKAADQGDSDAEILLGVCYERGAGVEQDADEAAKWYDKGVDTTGRPMTLAFKYLSGDGVEKDTVEAVTLFRVAADRGDVDALDELGDIYLYGFGVKKDAVEAVEWYRRAAEQGNSAAQNALGICYQLGTGLNGGVPDPVEAVKWYLRAANQGNNMAEEALGPYYMTGTGVIKNEVEGLAWFYVSSASGNQAATYQLPSFERDYSGAVVEAARQRATELQAQIASNKAMASDNSTTAAPQPTQNPNTPKESGSGAFISADGLVLTAAHVVQGASRIEVVTATGTLTATVVKIDATNDVAILRCAGNNFTPLPIAPSKDARAGATVFTVGFPNIQIQGFDPKLTKGEISSETGFQDDPRQWQISVPTQPGNSGGPLCDENGNLIGIVESTLNPLTMAKVEGEIPQNVNYAVKSSYILPLLDDVQNLPPPLIPANGTKFEDTVSNVQKSVVLILVY
jgi:uncharacterized protein